MTDPLDLLALITDGGLPPTASLMPGESAGIPTDQAGQLGSVPSAIPGQYGGRRQPGQLPAPRIPATKSAPKPRSVSGKGGIDLSNLGLGELLFLVLHPQGPAIIGAMVNATAQKQDRELQRQQMEVQAGRLQRANQMQDLQTQLSMNQMGAVPITPGVERVTGAMNEAFGPPQEPRMRAKTPVGDFYVPTAQEQQQKAYDAYVGQEELKARLAARAEGYKAAAKAAAEPKVPLAPDFSTFFKLGEVDALPQKSVDSMVRQYNALKPEKDHVTVRANNDGTMSVVRVGAAGTTVERVQGGPTVQTKEGGMTPAQQATQNRLSTKDAAAAMKHVQELITNATRKRPRGEGTADPATDPEWQAARVARDNAVAQYPDQLEAGPSEGGYPDIRWKQRATTPGTATTRIDPKMKAYADKYFGGDIERARAYAAAHP